MVATLGPLSSEGFDGDQRLLHRHTDFQFLCMLPPLRRLTRSHTFHESHERMTNAIESANHIGNARLICGPGGTPSSLIIRDNPVCLIKSCVFCTFIYTIYLMYFIDTYVLSETDCFDGHLRGKCGVLGHGTSKNSRGKSAGSVLTWGLFVGPPI